MTSSTCLRWPPPGQIRGGGRRRRAPQAGTRHRSIGDGPVKARARPHGHAALVIPSALERFRIASSPTTPAGTVRPRRRRARRGRYRDLGADLEAVLDHSGRSACCEGRWACRDGGRRRQRPDAGGAADHAGVRRRRMPSGWPAGTRCPTGCAAAGSRFRRRLWRAPGPAAARHGQGDPPAPRCRASRGRGCGARSRVRARFSRCLRGRPDGGSVERRRRPRAPGGGGGGLRARHSGREAGHRRRARLLAGRMAGSRQG